MNKSVLITGASSGLGYYLAEEFNSLGWSTINLSRSFSSNCKKNIIHDLEDIDNLKNKLESQLNFYSSELDLIILNAALLGDVNNITEISENSIQKVMNVNFMSNKIILDFVIKNNKSKSLNVIAISSGASQNPVSGWSSYCISKSSLNMLIECYAKEYCKHHFISICPGFIKTNMQKKIKQLNSEIFQDLVNIHSSYDSMPHPKLVANKIIKNLQKLTKTKSGKFLRLNYF